MWILLWLCNYTPTPSVKCSSKLCVNVFEDIPHVFCCPVNSPPTLHKLSYIWKHHLSPLKPALGTNWSSWLNKVQNGLPLLSVPWILYGVIPEPIIHLTSIDTSLSVYTVKNIFQNAFYHFQFAIYTLIWKPYCHDTVQWEKLHHIDQNMKHIYDTDLRKQRQTIFPSTHYYTLSLC